MVHPSKKSNKMRVLSFEERMMSGRRKDVPLLLRKSKEERGSGIQLL
jgi:hypothetical protein